MNASEEIQRPPPAMSAAFNLRIARADKLAAEAAAAFVGVTLSELIRAAVRAAVREILDEERLVSEAPTGRLMNAPHGIPADRGPALQGARKRPRHD